MKTRATLPAVLLLGLLILVVGVFLSTPAEAQEHDPCYYHAPTDHHHGVDPSTTIFANVVPDDLFCKPWQLSEKHEGYIYLYSEARGNGCELLSDRGIYGCVTHVLERVHSTGLQSHSNVREHSRDIWLRVCDKATRTVCGIVESHGVQDYGTLLCPYNFDFCPLESSPPVPVPYAGFSPYRSAVIDGPRALLSGKAVNIWSGQKPIPVMEQFYPNNPNALIGTIWSSSDEWQWRDKPTGIGYFLCSDFGPGCIFNHSRFQQFTVNFYMPNGVGPGFTGFTDKYGHISDCTVPEPQVCYPLSIGSGVPSGIPYFELSRKVVHNDPFYAPVQEFDVGSGLLPPD